MAFWMALAGMGASAIGGVQASASTLAGAKAQANIEAMNRAAQQKRFETDIKRQEPFFQKGEEAVPLYQQAVAGKFDVTQSPMYKMQAQMINDELQDAPQFVRDEAMQGLDVREGEAVKGRLLDMQQIGLGMSQSAGQSSLNFGNVMAQSIQRGMGALAQGQLTSDMQQQNTWMTAAESLSGIPAYMSQQNYMNKPVDMNAQAKLPGGKTSVFTNYDLTY